MPELAFSSGGVDTDAKNRQHEEKKEAEKKKHRPTTATMQQALIESNPSDISNKNFCYPG
jgi:hypothetical protein